MVSGGVVALSFFLIAIYDSKKTKHGDICASTSNICTIVDKTSLLAIKDARKLAKKLAKQI